MDLVSSIRIF